MGAGSPLLVMGCPRSGTTLLRAILDNHPELAMPPETGFVLPLWHERTRFGDLRRPEARRAVAEFVFCERARDGRRLRGHLPAAEAIDRVAAAPPTLGSLLAACFALYAERTGKPRWGDKRPRYAMFPEALLALFPGARLVEVVRDPRGAVASQIPMGWDEPSVALPASLANWTHSIERMAAVARRLGPDRLLRVRYEDLVADPDAELARVCVFAGLAADAATVEGMLAAPRAGKDSRAEDHTRFRGAIDPGRIRSWEHRLAPADVALIEHVAAEPMRRLGHEPVADGAAPDPAALREYRRQRRLRRARCRRVAARELARRLGRDRRPVAAVG